MAFTGNAMGANHRGSRCSVSMGMIDTMKTEIANPGRDVILRFTSPALVVVEDDRVQLL
ncbi:MAG: hypothetical protein IPM98_14050 [Lewinellaceae bacterium]|nr:hypothetical protein [Lewinellaceae bacterium]